MEDFQRVGGTNDFSEGLVRVFAVNGLDIGVVSHDGQFYAFSGRCPHAGYVFNYTRIRPGGRLLCSSHLAWFDLATGKVMGGPADRDLSIYRVRVDGEDVLVSTE